ncbi:MAG: alpha amylase, partial [Lachnospiraceae bacterium]|nr:alpha amylase [Lachnospiraceae bacterium]
AIIENYYTSLTPSMFNFDAADAEGRLIKAARGNYKAASFVESMAGYQKDYADKNPDYIDAPFITNHDMGRVANALMKDANDMKMAGGLLMTMNGSPFVYYGEEIGMSSSGQKDENKRLPMVWSDSDAAGMTNGPGDADKDIVFAFEGVEQQLEDPYSILNYYKRAVRLRNENPEIARGQIEIVESLTEGNQAVITKTYEDSTIGIVYNTSDDAITVELKDTVLADMAIRGYLTLNGEVVTLTNGALSMPAQSICILK